MMATMADAHREWHANAGVPMGQPGCPQDACHPNEDWADDEVAPPQAEGSVRCGNRRVHGDQVTYHWGVAGVRECYRASR